MTQDFKVLNDSILLEVLRENTEGISEYDLITKIKAIVPDIAGDMHNAGELFRTHFVLFNTLYRLRDQLWNEKKGHLDISPLMIRLLPYSKGEESIAHHDPLREYYLDVSHLDNMTEDDVYEMLAKFWSRMARQDGRSEALAELGLSDPVDDATIKRRYRELVMEHHPDRGGETEKLQTINAAIETLLEK